MTLTYIDKTADIYKYPHAIRQPSGTITIGDLHGNTVKLLYFLLHNGVVGFKNFEDPEAAYLSFVELYEKFGEIVAIRNELTWKIFFEEKKMQRFQKEVDSLGLNPQYNLLKDNDSRNIEEEAEYIKLQRPIGWLADSIKTIVYQREELEKIEPLKPLIEEFNGFMETLEVTDNLISVRLIGDEFADRGSCDYFTLRLLSLLKANDVKVTTILSNHSNEFINAYENLVNNEGLKPLGNINDSQKPSFIGLKSVFDDDIVRADEITHLVDSSYKPTLKILDYTLNANGIRLFTHAPVELNRIKQLASKLGVLYNDSTKENLGATIDKINTKFQQIAQENKVHEFFNTNINAINMSEKEIADWPLMYFTWNRFNINKDTMEKRAEVLNGYNIYYIHGHDDYKSTLEHVTNLDTCCGKESRKILDEKIKKANECLINPKATDKNKQDLIDYLESVNLYKIMDSNEMGLISSHDPDLIDKEWQQGNAILSPVMKKSLITGLFALGALVLSIIIGGALVGTGVFAPFGATLLGCVYFCLAIGGGLTPLLGLLGFGVAHYTQDLVVDTNVPDVSIGKNPMTKLGPRVEESNNNVSKSMQIDQRVEKKSIVTAVEQDKSDEESFSNVI